jgi:hypothetical protein
MTPTRYVYEPLSREEAEWRVRDAARWVKLYRATRSLIDEGDVAPLCAALREDSLYDLANLLERARFPGRGSMLSFEEPLGKREILSLIRGHEKQYGKRNSNGELLYGERQKAVNIVLGALTACGELPQMPDAEELRDQDAHDYVEKLRLAHDLTKLREKLVENLNHHAARQATPAATPSRRKSRRK